jgi:hypothetical protein
MTQIASQAEIVAYLGMPSTITEPQLGLLTMLHTLAEKAVVNFLQYDPTYQQHVQLLPPLGSREADVNLSDFDYTGGGRVTPGRGRRGQNRLQLKHLPVWATDIEVREDTAANGGAASDAFPVGSVLTYGTDYWLDGGEYVEDVDSSSDEQIILSRTGILHRAGVWPSVPRCLKVTYYAGWRDEHFTDGPASDLKMAVILKAAKSFRDSLTKQKTQGGAIQSESIGLYSVTYGSVLQTADPEIAARIAPFRHYGLLYA